MHPWRAKALAPINVKRAIDLKVPALENRSVIKKKPFFVFFSFREFGVQLTFAPMSRFPTASCVEHHTA